MKCPFCNAEFKYIRVLDTREVDEVVRRRRKCEQCQQRFTTYERVVEIELLVTKKGSKNREEFNKKKLIKSIQVACAKRPISHELIEQIATEIESTLNELTMNEVTSSRIGEMVLERLKAIDEVAYLRFASVYSQFENVDRIAKEIEQLQANHKE